MRLFNNDDYNYDIPTEVESLFIQHEETPATTIVEPAKEEPKRAHKEQTLNFWQRQVKNTNFKRAILNGAVIGVVISLGFYGATITVERPREMAMNYAADTIFYDLQTTQDDPNVSSEVIANDFKERNGFTTFKYNVVKLDDCISVVVEDPIFDTTARRAFGKGCFFQYSPDDQRMIDGYQITNTEDEDE